MEVLPQIVANFGSIPLAAQFSSGEPKFSAQFSLTTLPQNTAEFLKNILTRTTRAQISLQDLHLHIGGASIPLPQNLPLPLTGGSSLPVIVSLQENFLTLIQDDRKVHAVKSAHLLPHALGTSVTYLQEIAKDIFPAIIRQQAREVLVPTLHQDLGSMNEKTKTASTLPGSIGVKEDRVLTPSHLEKSSALKDLLLQVLHQKPASAASPHFTWNTKDIPNTAQELSIGSPPRPTKEEKLDLLLASKKQPVPSDGATKAASLSSQALLFEPTRKALLERLDALLMKPKLPPPEVKEVLQKALHLFTTSPELLETAMNALPVPSSFTTQSGMERPEQLLKVIREFIKTLDEPNLLSFSPSEKSNITSFLRGVRALLSRETSSTESTEPELQQGEKVLAQKTELLGALKVQPEARTLIQNVVEQFIQGQEMLGRLNPLMQQLGEPLFLLVPGFLQGFLQRLEVTISPAYDQQSGSKRNKHSQYSQCSVQCEFPSLGQIRIDIAYSKKQVLMRFIAESSSTASVIQENLSKLGDILRAAGFPRTDLCCQQTDRIDSVRPGWVGDITGLRMLV